MRSTRNLLLVLALCGMAIEAPVHAQSSDYPVECDGSKVTKAEVDRAHTVFLSGKQFLEESNYDKAISYFKDAYSIDCSVHAMLPIIATAYERKGDKGEAVHALEEYLKRATSAPDHDVIERRIRNLKDQLARDQAAVSASVATATASATAPPPVTTAGAEATAPVAPTQPSAPSAMLAAQHGAVPWVVTGVGAAGVLAGIVLYGIGAGDVSSAETKCPPPKHGCTGPGATAALDLGNRGRGLENAGGGLVGAGLAVIAAGLLWHFLEKPADSGANQSPGSGAQGSAVVGFGYAGASLSGRF